MRILEGTSLTPYRPSQLPALLENPDQRRGHALPPVHTRLAHAIGAGYYRRKANRNERDLNAFYFLGNYCMSLGRFDEAVTAYSHVVRLYPVHAASHGNLACALINAHRYEEARSEMERAVSLKPEFVPYLYTLAYVCGCLKDYPEAVGACQRLLLLDPEHTDALFLAAYGLMKLGVFSEAAKCFRRYLERHPEHTAAWHYLGLACIKTGSFSEAAEAMAKAGLIEPAQPAALPEPKPAPAAPKSRFAFPSVRLPGKVFQAKHHGHTL